MEPKALVYRNWDDLVFENRNKSYGAYILRRSYNDKVLLSFGVSIAILAFIFIGPKFISSNDVIIPKIICDFKGDIKLTDARFVIPKHSEVRVVSKRREIRQRTDLPPRVTSEPVADVPEVVEPSAPAVDIGDESGSELGESLTKGVGFVEAPPVVDVNKEYVNVEIMPTYEGGQKAMIKFLEKNLKYPSSARRMVVEGTVYVSFVVNGDGSVSKVLVLRGFHPACDAEAMRVVSLLPGWIGGKQGGFPVSVRMVLPIKFKLN